MSQATIAAISGLIPTMFGVVSFAFSWAKTGILMAEDAGTTGIASHGAKRGARAILTERFDEDADLKGALREVMWSNGRMASTVREGKQAAGADCARLSAARFEPAIAAELIMEGELAALGGDMRRLPPRC